MDPPLVPFTPKGKNLFGVSESPPLPHFYTSNLILGPKNIFGTKNIFVQYFGFGSRGLKNNDSNKLLIIKDFGPKIIG